MSRRTIQILILLALLSPLGCVEETGLPPENQPPTTYLNIVGTELDTTDYRKILHWWGTDTDGEVAGYLIRWDGGWEAPGGTEQIYQEEIYSFTTANRDTFDVPLDGEFAVRTFTVRAVDGQDLVDPNGVSQAFPLDNASPVLSWNPDIPRPSVSLPAVAFGWNPTDRNGRSTVREFRIWLDGDSASAWTVTDTIVAIRPEDFGERIDTERTIYVQAFDDARAPSNILSHRWTVESPHGEWLLIDQITGPGTSQWDRPFFESVLDSISGGSLHTIDLVDGPDFVTGVEIEALFTLFRGVVWVTGPYRESNDEKLARNLQTAEDGIAAYVREGGRILIAGQSLFGFQGGLSEEFTSEVCGVSSYYEKRVEPEGTRVTDLALNQDASVWFERDGQLDSLLVQGTSLRVEFFPSPSSPGTGKYWVPPGALEEMNGTATIPPQDEEAAYFAVLADWGEGRICLVTTSYARLFPRADSDPSWPESIREAVALFRETLNP